MRYLSINAGDKTVQVSKLALGTFGYGKIVSKEESFGMMDHYLEAGGNCLDCGRVYLGGICEEAVGDWLKDRKARDKVFLSTKGCHPPQNDMSVGRLTLKEMEYDLDLSLQSLQTDYIDFYWLHKDDRNRSVEAIVEDVNILLESGKVGAVGCSNWHTDRIEQANKYAAGKGLRGFELSQIQWSLARADQMQETFLSHLDVVMSASEYDWYCNNKMTVFAWGSQAHAVFTKVEKSGWDSVPPNVMSQFGSDFNKQLFERLKDYSKQSGISISALALAYVTCNQLPGVALIGCKNMSQLKDSLSAADVFIEPEVLEKIRNS